MILSSQLTEEIERIKFISNYDPTKLATEQKRLLDEHAKSTRQQKFSLFEAPSAKPPAKLTPQQTQAAKQKIQQQANKTANSIFQELMKAFDMDGDKVLTDYDGTNEGLAVAAIKKIKNKETLDALNKRIAATKQYKNLKSWLNAEMSDFDSEYGEIWSKLEKMGYDGANYNMLLKVAGYTPVGLMIKGADKAIDTLRGMTLDQIMEGFRDMLNSVGGIVVQALLSIFGNVLGAGINIFAWSSLLIYDINLAIKGKPNIWNIIIDIFSIVTNGLALKQLRSAKLAGAEVTTVGGTISTLATKYPRIFTYVETIGQKLSGWGAKLVQMIQNALGWLASKLPFLKKSVDALRPGLTKVIVFLEEIAKKIKEPFISKTASNLASQGLSKVGISNFIVSKVGQEGLKTFEKDVVKKVTDYLLKYSGQYTNEVLKKAVCKMGPTECSIYTFIEDGISGTKAVATVAAGTTGVLKNTSLTDTESKVKDLTKGLTDTRKGANLTASLF